MKTTKNLLLCTLLVSGCTLGAEPEPPTIPQVPPLMISSESFPAPTCPMETVQVTVLPSRPDPSYTPHPKASLLKKGERPLRPEEVVVQAQKAARIEPSERGYGGNGVQVFQWTPGKIYTIYLSKKQASNIFLPPGEKLISGLFLDPEAYDVQTKRAGVGERAYDAVMIRPMGDNGSVDTLLLTESGKQILLHLVVGNVGMIGVTFEGLTTAAQARVNVEPPLVLPRPPQ